ncbi:MAG: 2-amino-4-hydroxy-6-hydroxymethyldihydropteridine diphosphokinase [Terracidiphilus sp.]|jgi:2-amino-4-hydroxy-6-hydroxymethyldihydropteridine diphosphokinase
MHTAYIGMGANLPSHAGPPEATLAAAAARLASLGRLVCRSSLYSTEPVGFAAQPRFVNAAVALETDLDPHALLAALLRIEKEFGRDRSSAIHNGPRTLDLDILLLGNVNISEPGLEIPHPRLADRAFVLFPLNEIAPRALEARSGRTVAQLLQSLNSTGESTADAVVQVESELWRPGADRDVFCPDAPPRTNPSDNHR